MPQDDAIVQPHLNGRNVIFPARKIPLCPLQQNLFCLLNKPLHHPILSWKIFHNSPQLKPPQFPQFLQNVSNHHLLVVALENSRYPKICKHIHQCECHLLCRLCPQRLKKNKTSHHTNHNENETITPLRNPQFPCLRWRGGDLFCCSENSTGGWTTKR